MQHYRKVDVWCSHPDHVVLGDHALTEDCIEPYTWDVGGPPDVKVMDPPEAPPGRTWADGVFSEDRPWPEVSS